MATVRVVQLVRIAQITVYADTDEEAVDAAVDMYISDQVELDGVVGEVIGVMTEEEYQASEYA